MSTITHLIVAQEVMAFLISPWLSSNKQKHFGWDLLANHKVHKMSVLWNSSSKPKEATQA
jgi:hypothetical protein